MHDFFSLRLSQLLLAAATTNPSPQVPPLSSSSSLLQRSSVLFQHASVGPDAPLCPHPPSVGALGLNYLSYLTSTASSRMDSSSASFQNPGVVSFLPPTVSEACRWIQQRKAGPVPPPRAAGMRLLHPALLICCTANSGWPNRADGEAVSCPSSSSSCCDLEAEQTFRGILLAGSSSHAHVLFSWRASSRRPGVAIVSLCEPFPVR